jgi:hypothetical protein
MRRYDKIVNKADVDKVGYNTYIFLIFIALNVLITAVLVLTTR